MKRFGALALIGVSIILEVVNAQQYSTRYNNLNIDQILSSDRLVTNYVECLLSRKPCPPEGKDLKRILPEALKTKCLKCSVQQREGALRVITKLYYDYPTQYNRLRGKWDPTGEYHRRFEEYLRGLQFNTINNEPTAQQSSNVPSKQPPPIKPQPSIIASASSNSPTAIPPNLAVFNNTQIDKRPARNPEIAQPNTNIRTTNSIAPPNGVFNRFGADDDDMSGGPAVVQSAPTTTTIFTTTTERALPTLAAVPSQRPAQQTTRQPAQRVRPVAQSPAMTQPDVVYVAQQHPLLGLINSIGFKISNTADFFAGMLRGTIQRKIDYRGAMNDTIIIAEA